MPTTGLDNHCNPDAEKIKEGIKGGEDGRTHARDFKQASYVAQIAPPMLPAAIVVCVCACPPVMRGDTVKHALTSTSSPSNDVPSIPWSPVVLPLWTLWGAC
jgi:hypothetical protein